MAAVFGKPVALLYNVSSVFLALILIYLSQPGSSLFSWHPTLMSLAVCVLMAHGMVTFNEEFDVVRPPSKSSRLDFHWIIQASAILLMWTGFASIYYHKESAGKQHFATWHGLLGWNILISVPGVALGGALAKYKVRVPFVHPKYIKWVHRLGGTAIFTVCSVELLLGLLSTWAVANVPYFILYPMMAAIVFMASLTWYAAKEKKMLTVPSIKK